MPPGEFTNRGSVPLRGGEDSVDTPSQKTDLLPTKEQDRRRPSAVVPMRPWPTDVEGLSVQRGGAPDRAYQLLCECSYRVRCEVMCHGERVRYCPGCRSRLSLLSVRPRGWTKTQSRCGKAGR